MTDVLVPTDLWDGNLEGAVTVWFVEQGDHVSEGDVLCEMAVEKSAFEITAPATGKITLLVAPEAPVRGGTVIAQIGN